MPRLAGLLPTPAGIQIDAVEVFAMCGALCQISVPVVEILLGEARSGHQVGRETAETPPHVRRLVLRLHQGEHVQLGLVEPSAPKKSPEPAPHLTLARRV